MLLRAWPPSARVPVRRLRQLVLKFPSCATLPASTRRGAGGRHTSMPDLLAALASSTGGAGAQHRW